MGRLASEGQPIARTFLLIQTFRLHARPYLHRERGCRHHGRTNSSLKHKQYSVVKDQALGSDFSIVTARTLAKDLSLATPKTKTTPILSIRYVIFKTCHYVEVWKLSDLAFTAPHPSPRRGASRFPVEAFARRASARPKSASICKCGSSHWQSACASTPKSASICEICIFHSGSVLRAHCRWRRLPGL